MNARRLLLWSALLLGAARAAGEDIETYRAEYKAQSDALAAKYDAKASQFRKTDGTVDTSNPEWQKIDAEYKAENAKLRQEFVQKHPSATSMNEVRQTPAGQNLKNTGSPYTSAYSDGDWTATTDADAANVAEQLKAKGHKVTYDSDLGMWMDESADTKIWEPENEARARARANNPEGYTRSGSLDHEGIKSPNAQYDPEGYVEDLNKKYEAAKAKGDTRTMNKVAAKMQEATGKPFDPVTQTMRVDANPFESGEQTLGESEEVKKAKAQERAKALDKEVAEARAKAKAQSESNTKMRDDLAKKERDLGNKKSAQEYEDANKKIENTKPKSEPPKTEPGKTTGTTSDSPPSQSEPAKPGKTSTPKTEAPRTPDTPPESVRTPPKTTEPARPPSAPTEPLKTPPSVTEPVQTPSTTPEPVKTPPKVTDPVKPPTTPEPAKTPPTAPEPVKTPPSTPEPVKTPVAPEPVKTPATTPEPVEIPPTTTEPVRTSPTATEPVKTPPTTPEPVKAPGTTTEPVKPPSTTPEPVKPPSATPEPVKTPAATPEPVQTPASTPEPVKTPTTPAGTSPGETWVNPLTGKTLPVGTSGSKIVDGGAKVLQNPKVQGGLNVIGGAIVAKDGYDTINKINTAADKGDLKTVNVEGGKGLGRIGGGYVGGVGGAKAGALIGGTFGDGPGAVVGGFIGAIVGGIGGAILGEKAGEKVVPAAIDGLRTGGQKVMENYYGVDDKQPGEWEPVEDTKGFDRIEKVMGDGGKDSPASAPSGFSPPVVHTTPSGGRPVTPTPGGGSPYKPPTTPTTPGGGIDVSVPGQDMDDIDFGAPPDSAASGDEKPKPVVKPVPPKPPEPDDEPGDYPEPEEPPDITPPVTAPEPPEVAQPSGTETIEKGWVKDDKGTIKVTETKGPNGNVISITHTEYDANGNIIGSTTYPVGQGTDASEGGQPEPGMNDGGEPEGESTGTRPPTDDEDIFPCPMCGHRCKKTELVPASFNSKLLVCGSCADQNWADSAEDRTDGRFKCFSCGKTFSWPRVEEDEPIPQGDGTSLIPARNYCPHCDTLLKTCKGSLGKEFFDADIEDWATLRGDPICATCGAAMGYKFNYENAQAGWDSWDFLCPRCAGTVRVPGPLFGETNTVQASELRQAEARTSEDVLIPSRPDTPGSLATYRDERDLDMEQRTGNGLSLMGNQTDLQNASNIGNETIRDAKRVRDTGGQDAQKIADDNQRTTRIEQDKDKSKILDAVINGVGTGVKTTAGHFGTEVGKGVGDKIFKSGKKEEPQTAGTGGTVAPATPPSPGGGATTIASTPSGGTTKGTTSGGQPPSGGGPVCVVCGAPAYMEFEGVGWLCHDCESKGHDYPPGGTTAEPGTDEGTEPVILADAICPICGQMYNPAFGHQCPGAVQAPTAGTEPPAAPPTGVICGHCGQRVPKVSSKSRGSGWGTDDGSYGSYHASIENACDACIAKWEAQCDAEAAKIQPKPTP
ncbi:MAG: hypothetical protein KA248_07095 [Kiritimatiellae bacterium]|nr:hypothetical protein [Kiritimatiellia bacterium]